MTFSPSSTSAPTPSAPARGSGRRWLWRDVDDVRDLFGSVTPNWYASIMGTGIVAVAAATLPFQSSALRIWATGVWILATVLLITLTVAFFVHLRVAASKARGYLTHPVMAHFLGAPPMALLTVGTGTLLLGGDLLGQRTVVVVDAVLWTLGTLLGFACAWYVTYTTFIGRNHSPVESTFGGRLMPVVPPMVSAASGALLVPHIPAGEPRLLMFLACYAMFGLSLVASLPIIVMLWTRLVQHGPGETTMVPTLWIVLGPLGQSITAANLLGDSSHHAVSARLATAFELFGVVYGLPVLGFALLWASVAAAVTVHRFRGGAPFALTWWSFTFPVGTCVTGVGGLAGHTGSVTLAWLAAVLYVGLVAAWIVVATRTFHGSVVSGRLLTPS
ncbi:TDT family transporter [Nocardiopsis alba]|uniref:TDT family transporter n=1 Tax=Nocardiopsis alba TaxID=53437 RepID=UPI003632F6CC